MSIETAYDNLVENHLITEPLSVYNGNRSKYFSSTAAKTLIKDSAADLKHQMDNPSNEVKPAFILGNAVHSLVLEGTVAFQNDFVIGGPKDNKGKEFGMKSDAFAGRRKAVNAEGKELITREEYKKAWAMKKSVYNHTLAASILDKKITIAERVIRTNFMDVDCQVRYDLISRRVGIPDLKTCADLRWFQRDVLYKYGYIYQAGFYQLIAHSVAPEFGYLPFMFIAVESKPPYKVGVFPMKANDMAYCRMKVMDAFLKFKECKESGVWPTGYEETIYIELKNHLT